MKHIVKEKKEPEKWKEYRETPGVVFSAIPELKQALLKEQGYICCYCMCRIDFANMKVEHYIPRSDKSKIFKYSNLLAACEGVSAENRNCDTAKGNRYITINPCDILNNCERIIKYHSSSGEIFCEEPYYTDINVTLNLNDSRIKRNRKSVLDGAITGLNHTCKAKGFEWSKKNVGKVIEHYSKKDSDGKYHPYCGIVIYFLNKKLSSY